MKEEIGKSIICLRNEISRSMELLGVENSLSRAQGTILHYVFYESKNKDVYQKDIEQEFNLRRASASELLQKLENGAYIERISNESDKRLKKILITDKGKLHVEQVRQNIQCMEETLQKNIEDDQLKVFYDVISQMYENCKNMQIAKKGEMQ